MKTALIKTLHVYINLRTFQSKTQQIYITKLCVHLLPLLLQPPLDLRSHHVLWAHKEIVATHVHRLEEELLEHVR